MTLGGSAGRLWWTFCVKCRDASVKQLLNRFENPSFFVEWFWLLSCWSIVLLQRACRYSVFLCLSLPLQRCRGFWFFLQIVVEVYFCNVCVFLKSEEFYYLQAEGSAMDIRSLANQQRRRSQGRVGRYRANPWTAASPHVPRHCRLVNLGAYL